MKTYVVRKEMDHAPLPTRTFEARRGQELTEDKLVYSDGTKIPDAVLKIWFSKGALEEVKEAKE